MELNLQLQNSNDGTVYDISEIAQEVKVEKSIDGVAGKLTCILQKDPYDNLSISNGSTVIFRVDDNVVFVGYVFTIGTDIDENYSITCYDKLRYLKNSDNYTFSGMTASDIFKKICEDYQLPYEVRYPTKYVPEAHQFLGKSLYDIIIRGLNLAVTHDKKKYFIIDEAGKLVWSEFKEEAAKIVVDLNEYSGIFSYTYEKSIDNDTYNRVKLYQKASKTSAGETADITSWVVYDSNNMKRWGILQYLDEVDEKYNSAEVTEMAQNLLKVKNRETETLKLQGEGILECVAGQTIRFKLERENIDKYMWIKSSSHTFTKYQHTMDLEVEV